MCDPATATLILTAAAGASATIGGIQSAKQQQAGLNYQAQLNDVNAVNAQRAARDALERGELDAVKHGREVAQLRGSQQVSVAQAGIEAGFGSPLDIATDTDLLAAEDTRTIYENANREAEGYRINAANYKAEAAGNRAQSKNVGTQAIIDAGSTVLSTASQMGGQWQKYGKPKWGK